MALGPGSVFADYVVEDEVGRGGMSVVYRAREMHPARTVALKVLSPDLAGDAAFRKRFLRESDLAASIGHPNIVPIFDAGEAEGHLFIAMPLIPGRDLGAVIREQGALSLDRVTGIVEQVGRALDAAHGQGLVHRDIKPGNVLLAPGSTPGEREHVYLADFGLARRRAAETRLTEHQSFLGTRDYAAPEQIRGEDVDGRADIYALGCVVYEALTGAPPFAGESESALMYAHLEKDPPALAAIRPHLAPVDPVIARAMAKHPDARFQSGRDLTAALAAAAAQVQAAGPAATVVDAPAVVTPTVIEPVGAVPRAAHAAAAHAPPPTPPPPAQYVAAPAPPPPAPAAPGGGGPSRRTLGLIAAGAVVVVAGVGVALLAGGGDDGSAATTAVTVPTAQTTTESTPTATTNTVDAATAEYTAFMGTFDARFGAVTAAIPSGANFGKPSFALGAVRAARAVNRITDRPRGADPAGRHGVGEQTARRPARRPRERLRGPRPREPARRPGRGVARAQGVVGDGQRDRGHRAGDPRRARGRLSPPPVAPVASA